MVEIGSGAKREQKDYRLTRYACYIIAQNSNPRLKVIAKNGGTMPEDLPTPKKSLKELEKENRQNLKSNNL